MKDKPLVTVFIPYYNDEKFLRIAIEAVLNNDYENFELILLNHATTDSCRDIAHSYNDLRIKHIDVEKNTGAGGGLLFEEMLKIARGKYIKPLCADDVLLKDGLKILVDYMEDNPERDFAFGNVEYIDIDNNDLGDNWFETREYFSVNYNEVDLMQLYLRGISCLPYIGSIIKRDILDEININKTFIMMFDMSLWLSLLCKGFKVGFINQLVANYRIHNGQISGNEQRIMAERLSWYEQTEFWKIFLTIDNIDLARKICTQSRYIKFLTVKEDIPFVIAQAFFKNLRPYPYAFLNSLLNNTDTRKHLEVVFGYGIKELREECRKDYANTSISSGGSLFKTFKRNLYAKSVKNLRIRELVFLGFRRFFNIIFAHKTNKNKQYSL